MGLSNMWKEPLSWVMQVDVRVRIIMRRINTPNSFILQDDCLFCIRLNGRSPHNYSISQVACTIDKYKVLVTLSATPSLTAIINHYT